MENGIRQSKGVGYSIRSIRRLFLFSGKFLKLFPTLLYSLPIERKILYPFLTVEKVLFIEECKIIALELSRTIQ